jgi:hypothetical protein
MRIRRLLPVSVIQHIPVESVVMAVAAFRVVALFPEVVVPRVTSALAPKVKSVADGNLKT